MVSLLIGRNTVMWRFIDYSLEAIVYAFYLYMYVHSLDTNSTVI